MESACATLSADDESPLRIAFVCHTGYLAGNSFGGATLASLALMREGMRVCAGVAGAGADVFALAQSPLVEALVFKLGDDSGAVGLLEGTADAAEQQRVPPSLIGDPAALLTFALARVQAMGAPYHAVFTISIEPVLVEFANKLPSMRRYGLCHNYYMPPFGPLSKFSQGGYTPERGVQASSGTSAVSAHVDALRKQDAILSPCEHHAAYLRRWAPPDFPPCAPLFAAEYRYFHTNRDAAGGLGLPQATRPWEEAHRYVTLVSASPAKGLCVLLALARRLPHVPFAAVATGWLKQACRARIEATDAVGTRLYPNITVLAAEDDVDAIFAKTKVLLAPSLWQECCPLIVMEALLRGVPCVSSDVFGLPEANLNPRLVCHASLCFDHVQGELLRGVTNEELAERIGAVAPPLPAQDVHSRHYDDALNAEATDDEARPFEKALLPLLTDDDALRSEAAVGYNAFTRFATERADGFAELVHAISRQERQGAAEAEADGRRAAEDAPRLKAPNRVAGHRHTWRRQGAQRPPSSLSAQQSWPAASEIASLAGLRAPRVVQTDLQQGAQHAAADPGSGATGTGEALPPGVEWLVPTRRYRCICRPFCCVRAAPSFRAAVADLVIADQVLEVDAISGTDWVRTAKDFKVEAPKAMRMWLPLRGPLGPDDPTVYPLFEEVV